MAMTEDPQHSDASDGVSEEVPSQLSGHSLLYRLGGLALLIIVVAILVTSLPGLGELRHRFAGASWWLIALIPVLKLCSCISNVVAFRDVFCPKMGWRFTYQLSMAEQGTNVLVPTGGVGGLALGAWALRQGGMSTEHLTRRSVTFFVLTSIPNFACAALFGPLLLLGVFSGKVPAIPTIAFTALAWLAVIVAVILTRVLIHLDPNAADHKWAVRVRAGAALAGQGLADVGALFRDRRWRAILGACGYLGFDIAALVVAFAAFGHVVGAGPLIFAYVVGQLGGLIPIPAGIGGIDGGLIGALVLYGAPLTQATAAEFAYHTFQLTVPAILGTIAFVRLRQTLRQSKAPAIECVWLAEHDPTLEPQSVQLPR
jgi:uncharacterized membrane protein YbhN (UPF0104 family)